MEVPLRRAPRRPARPGSRRTKARNWEATVRGCLSRRGLCRRGLCGGRVLALVLETAWCRIPPGVAYPPTPPPLRGVCVYKTHGWQNTNPRGGYYWGGGVGYPLLKAAPKCCEECRMCRASRRAETQDVPSEILKSRSLSPLRQGHALLVGATLRGHS